VTSIKYVCVDLSGPIYGLVTAIKLQEFTLEAGPQSIPSASEAAKSAIESVQ